MRCVSTLGLIRILKENEEVLEKQERQRMTAVFCCGCLFGLVSVFKFSFLGDTARVKGGYGGGEKEWNSRTWCEIPKESIKTLY